MLQARDDQLWDKNANRRRSHYFNSFFVNQLIDTKKAYCYNNVKRYENSTTVKLYKKVIDAHLKMEQKF
jgi:Ulp1 family protease